VSREPPPLNWFDTAMGTLCLLFVILGVLWYGGWLGCAPAAAIAVPVEAPAVRPVWPAGHGYRGCVELCGDGGDLCDSPCVMAISSDGGLVP
jgi:hypothetical protein